MYFTCHAPVILPFEARARLDAMNHEERICGYTDPAANVTLDDLVVRTRGICSARATH